MIKTLSKLIVLVLFVLSTSCLSEPEPPNVLLIITDDQSWEHLGCYGDKAVKTPNIDKLALKGIRFENAYTPCPSCSPSRAALLTGQDIFRLKEGGVLTGFIRKEYKLFPSLLEGLGYHVGYTGKGYWPFTRDAPDGVNEPIGQRYDEHRLDSVPQGLSKRNYAANFEQFIQDKQEGSPFFFWLGFGEPHRPYETGRGVDIGIDTSLIRIPAFFPNVPVAKLDMADYLAEVQWADQVVGEVLELLDRYQLRENTLIIFTSDNGMPFPRAKASLYAHGVRMPLVLAWDEEINEMRVIKDPVNLIDLAPTLLELAGAEIPEQMTGRSLAPVILDKNAERTVDQRGFVVTAFEKHTHCRPNELGFPRRAIHTEEWTYIYNYEADRMPFGNYDIFIPNWDILGDIDPGPLKEFYKENILNGEYEYYYKLAFGKVGTEELYNHLRDPDMVSNLAYDPDFQEEKQKLRQELEDYLLRHKDPRSQGKSPWDDYRLDK
jgi:uncharacterized sulfatase